MSGLRPLALCAGEPSGDAYAAAVLPLLQTETPAFSSVYGIAGRAVFDPNFRRLGDSSQWGAISIVESLRTYPKVLPAYYALKRALRAGPPGVFLPIDFGYANIRLARHAKNCGWQVVYWVPPGSWRRDRQGRDLAAVTDAIVTPFPWSRDLLRAQGANVEFFGHPILQFLRDVPRLPVDERTTLALLPGSRAHELEQMLPLMAATLARLQFRAPLEFALAPGTDARRVETIWRSHGGADATFTVGATREVLGRARAALVCSGTATLESILSGAGTVVAYQLSPMARREAKLIRMKRPRFIALPNIILDEAVVPEFVNDEATPEVLAGALQTQWENPSPQRAAESRIRETLGPDDAIDQTARYLREFAENQP